jgi:hypothetical protein
MQHLASSSWSMLAGVSSPGGGVPTLPESLQDNTHSDSQSQPQEANSPVMTPAAEATQPKANAAGNGGTL